MVVLKSPDEIGKIRQSSIIVAEILQGLAGLVKPGVTTRELDTYAETEAHKRGARPAFKGYNGYPFALCTSLNQEVVHGFPSENPLKEGDIVSLDFGVCYRDYFGDSAVTLPVGRVSETATGLLKATEEALYRGIDEATEHNRVGDISFAVQNHVERLGFSVVREYVGHGIGRKLHEDPPVPNFGVRGRGIELKPGMVFAIEPMVNEGTHKVKVKPDGWTVVTADGKLSAHFEHTVAITENGPEILSTLV
jgi:methionyl aminopeptidase